MGVNPMGLVACRTGRAPEEGITQPPGPCSLEAIARVLSCLLRRPVSLEQVREKAVGLGLLHHAECGDGGELTAQAVSRLLLAGYHLPAQVEVGTLPLLAEHARAQRLVFVLPGAPEESDGLDTGLASPVLQVHKVQDAGPGDSWFLLGEPGGSPATKQLVSLDHPLIASSIPASFLLLVAAQHWSDLPQEGNAFFAGSRDANGVYHWNSAECDTDATGRILRY
jgi:hypothetical protein